MILLLGASPSRGRPPSISPEVRLDRRLCTRDTKGLRRLTLYAVTVMALTVAAFGLSDGPLQYGILLAVVGLVLAMRMDRRVWTTLGNMWFRMRIRRNLLQERKHYLFDLHDSAIKRVFIVHRWKDEQARYAFDSLSRALYEEGILPIQYIDFIWSSTATAARPLITADMVVSLCRGGRTESVFAEKQLAELLGTPLLEVSLLSRETVHRTYAQEKIGPNTVVVISDADIPTVVKAVKRILGEKRSPTREMHLMRLFLARLACVKDERFFWPFFFFLVFMRGKKPELFKSMLHVAVNSVPNHSLGRFARGVWEIWGPQPRAAVFEWILSVGPKVVADFEGFFERSTPTVGGEERMTGASSEPVSLSGVLARVKAIPGRLRRRSSYRERELVALAESGDALTAIFALEELLETCGDLSERRDSELAPAFGLRCEAWVRCSVPTDKSAETFMAWVVDRLMYWALSEKDGGEWLRALRHRFWEDFGWADRVSRVEAIRRDEAEMKDLDRPEYDPYKRRYPSIRG